jgi:hypothetical protein
MTRSNSTPIGILGSPTAVQTSPNAPVVFFDLLPHPLGNLLGHSRLRILYPSFERNLPVLGEQVDARQRDRQHDSYYAVGTAGPGSTSGVIHNSCASCECPHTLW